MWVDFTTFAGTVNKECERFKISSITDEQFKCLIFVCGLRSARYRDVHTRILSKIEQNPDMTLQQAAEECRGLVNLKHNNQSPQQHPQWTPFKESNTQHHLAQYKRNLYPLAGIVLTGILQGNVHSKHCCWECNQQGHIERFCTPPVHKTTNKRPHNKRRLKRKTQSASNFSLQLKVKPEICQ